MAKKTGAKKGAVAPASISNRRARYDYAIDDTFECGIVLVGTEVKSLFKGNAHLTDSYCRVVNGEMFLFNMDIEPYEQAGNLFQHERRRDRKLLLHRREIDTLDRKAKEKGFTIIPLDAYFKNGRVKIRIGLGKGKAEYDKRHKLAQTETRREVEQARSLKF